MAEKDARVRLNLAAGGFTSLLRELEKQAGKFADEVEGIGEAAEKTDKKSSALVGTWKRGFGAAGSALTEMGSKLKSTLGQIATLGGAVSLGGLVHSAVELSDRYDDIRFNVNKVAGNMETLASVQSDIEGAASRTKVPIEAMADAYEKVFKSTGDLAFTKASLEAIGTVATATGEDVENIANAAQLLQRKFKISAAELPEALARFVEKTGVGGKGLDELSNRFALMAGEASEAGLSGSEGLSQLLGMLNQLDSAVGEKADPALKSMFQTLKSGSSQLKALEKAGGIKFGVDDTAFQKLQKLISDPKARKAAESIFTGDARTVFDELAKPFDEAVATAKAEGKKGKELKEAGVKAFEANLAAAGKSAMGYADIQDQFAQAASGPKEQLTDAINKLKMSFTQPEMIGAIEKLAEKLPALAEGMAKLVEFVVDNPLLAGGAFVAGKAGGALGGSVMSDVGKAARDALKPASKEAGVILAKTAAAHPNWAMAGKAMGVAAAAAAGVMIGKAIVDARMETKEKNQNDVIMGGVEAHGAALSGDPKRMAEAHKALKAKIAKMKKDQGGLGGAFDTFMGGLVTVMPGGDPNFVAPEQKQLMTAQADLRKLEQAMARGAKGGDKAGDSLERMARAADRASGILEKIPQPGGGGGGGGNNGLPPTPGNQSGSAPR